jgi:hypothetical protein
MSTLQQSLEWLNEERNPKPALITFRTLRRTVGWLGISLPFALWWGGLLLEACRLQPSISHYYYTNMREVFVGVMCAVSLFLFTYKGHTKLDSYLANAAGLFSLGVVVFPTNIIDSNSCQERVPTVLDLPFHNTIHLTSAALFFSVLAFMSIYLFTKTNKPINRMGRQKKLRNTLYKLCGWIMVLCLVLIGISKPVLKVSETSTLTFWMETVALVAFGFSWLTKGDGVGVLNDKEEFHAEKHQQN